MKIRGKLFLMNLVAIAGFGAITLGTALSVNNMHKLNALAREGLALQDEFHIFVLRGMDLSLTTNLKDSFDKWKDQEKFRSLYENFVGSPDFRTIPSSQKRIDRFAFMWKSVQTKSDDLSTQIAGLIEKDGAGGTQIVVGLTQGYAWYGDVGFNTAFNDITSLSTIINDFLAPPLADLVQLTSARAQASERTLISLIVGLAIAVSAASIVLFTLFGNGLVRRVRSIARSMGNLEAKDFSTRLDTTGGDELTGIASAMNTFIDAFSHIIEGIKVAAGAATYQRNEVASAMIESSASVTEMTANISSIGTRVHDLVETLGASNRSVRNITESLDSLAARIENQSALIGRSTSSIEQMDASISKVAGIVSKRKGASRELIEVTRNGGSLIDETNLLIHEVVSQIGQINEIVAIIDGISGMTDLLSMNAAIEAAHAGNAGRGFAVVAEEIRKLADSTAENAKRIKAMIGAISETIVKVLNKSESSKAGFEAIASEVDYTTGAMTEISMSMDELSTGSREIMSATEELSSIATEVSDEATRMHASTDGILRGIASVEEISKIVRTGMEEMEVGTKEMATAMAAMNDMELKSRASIEKLNEDVAGFKTSAEAPEVETSGELGEEDSTQP